MPCELWRIAPPTLPPRSRLYSLAPMGIGSSQVECVTSYMMRIADAHAVSLGTLIREEICPNLTACPKRLSFAALHSLNGSGPCFVQWVEILGSLTARNDLRALTLLPWRGVLASDGSVRRYRAWCPHCYQECRDHESAVYDPLLWMLAPVTVCPRHEIPLLEICPHCGKRSLPLSARGRCGFCSHCGGWLGTSLPAPTTDASAPDLESRLHTARDVGNLLSTGVMQNTPIHSHLGDNVQRVIANWTYGNRLLFCRIAGVNERTLIAWLSVKVLPSFALLIRIARNLKIPLKRLLLDEIPADDAAWIQIRTSAEEEQVKSMNRRAASKQLFEHPVTRDRLWALSSCERTAAKTEVKAAMESALDEDVPRSVRDIFRSLGYRHCVMGRYWFPELYAAIQAKRRRRFDGYSAELQSALNEMPPPTVTQVAQRLGVNVNSLRRACPDLYARLCLFRPDRRQFQIAQTEVALKKAFEDAPASLVQLAVRLHRNPDKLRLTYPELCADLHQRNIAHQSAERWKLDLIYQTCVRQATEELTAAGKYPSRIRVQSLITTRNPSLTSIFLTGRALRHVRQEMIKTVPGIAELECPKLHVT
jgi:transcriptional regulator with XRE-family HTH domain